MAIEIDWRKNKTDLHNPPIVAFGYINNELKLRIITVMGKSVLVKESNKEHLFPPSDEQSADFETCVTAAEFYKDRV